MASRPFILYHAVTRYGPTFPPGSCLCEASFGTSMSATVSVDPRWNRDDIFEEAEIIAMNDEGIYQSICAAMDGETPQATEEYEGWALGGHQA